MELAAGVVDRHEWGSGYEKVNHDRQVHYDQVRWWREGASFEVDVVKMIEMKVGVWLGSVDGFELESVRLMMRVNDWVEPEMKIKSQ